MIPRSYASPSSVVSGMTRSTTPNRVRARADPVPFPSADELVVDSGDDVLRGGDSISVTVRFRPLRSVLELWVCGLDLDLVWVGFVILMGFLFVFVFLVRESFRKGMRLRGMLMEIRLSEVNIIMLLLMLLVSFFGLILAFWKIGFIIVN